MKCKTPTPDELMTAIRIKCLDYSGGSRKMVESCELKECALYPYRSKQAMGMAGEKAQVKGQIDLFELLKAGEA